MKNKIFVNLLAIFLIFSVCFSVFSLGVFAVEQINSPYLICESIKQLKKDSNSGF